MTGIVCLDQEDGLLFNGRRQSRDRVVTEKILSMTEGKPLWMSAYSRRIFPEDAPVCVAEDLMGKLEELAEPARKDVEQVESAQEELEREKAAQKESGQQSGEATFCLIEEAVNLETENIDEWIAFRWKRVYPADVFLKFPADGWEKELIETFAGYSHEEIDLERYRKKDRAKF